MSGERGIAFPDEYRENIMRCDDVAKLDEWIARAATAGTWSEVY